ncbi:holin [Enterococcus sp. LJL128]
MDEIITHVLATGLSFAPIMMIVTEAVKQTGVITSKYLPLISITLGIILGFIMGVCFDQNVAEMTIGGLVAGGMACGLYDATNKYNTRKEE